MHLTLPLFTDAKKATEFLNLVRKVAPGVRSIGFEDASFEGSSATEVCCPEMAAMGINALRWRVHEASSVESMKALR